MNYTVDTSDGAMTYGSLEQLREAVRLRLVQPQDLVHPEGTSPVPVSALVRTGSPPTLTATRPTVKLERRRFRAPTVVAIAAATVTLLQLELPRLTLWVPALWKLPLVAEVFPRAAPGGALPFGVFPAWLGWTHLLAGALVAYVIARAFSAAAFGSIAFLALVGGWFAATGRWPLAVPLCAGAIAISVVLIRRRWQRK